MSQIIFGNTDFPTLAQVIPPSRTETYSPIAHTDVRNEILEQIDKTGMEVYQESYKSSVNGQRVIGQIDLKDGNSDLGMRIAFRNSYDKSMSLAFVGGSQVWICSNGLISGELQFVRKHTGNISGEMVRNIENSFKQMEEYFAIHTRDSDIMKQVEINDRTKAELAGRMFIEEEILSPRQLSTVKSEIQDPTFAEFDTNSVWSFYNNITHSLKKSAPTEYIQKHIKTHEFFSKELEIV